MRVENWFFSPFCSEAISDCLPIYLKWKWTPYRRCSGAIYLFRASFNTYTGPKCWVPVNKTWGLISQNKEHMQVLVSNDCVSAFTKINAEPMSFHDIIIWRVMNSRWTMGPKFRPPNEFRIRPPYLWYFQYFLSKIRLMWSSWFMSEKPPPPTPRRHCWQTRFQHFLGNTFKVPFRRRLVASNLCKAINLLWNKTLKVILAMIEIIKWNGWQKGSAYLLPNSTTLLQTFHPTYLFCTHKLKLQLIIFSINRNIAKTH